MAIPDDRYVVHNRRGGWDVKGPKASRSSRHFRTQAEAQQRAKQIVGNRSGGGEVRIQGRDGKWRDSDTVRPGNDPFPPRDKRH